MFFQGALSPIEGIGPEDLKISELLQRVKSSEFKEIILATNPSLEGDATAMYLQTAAADPWHSNYAPGPGLPVGGDLEYADQNTILRALRVGRKWINAFSES